jgi:hypothetical protein
MSHGKDGGMGERGLRVCCWEGRQKGSGQGNCLGNLLVARPIDLAVAWCCCVRQA